MYSLLRQVILRLNPVVRKWITCGFVIKLWGISQDTGQLVPIPRISHWLLKWYMTSRQHNFKTYIIQQKPYYRSFRDIHSQVKQVRLRASGEITHVLIWPTADDRVAAESRGWVACTALTFNGGLAPGAKGPKSPFVSPYAYGDGRRGLVCRGRCLLVWNRRDGRMRRLESYPEVPRAVPV